MSDPVRWRTEAGGAPDGVRDLLRQAAAPKALSAASKAQHAAMLAKLAAGTGAVATTAAAGAQFALSTKVMLGLAMTVAAAGVGVTQLRAHRSARPVAASQRAHAGPLGGAQGRVVASQNIHSYQSVIEQAAPAIAAPVAVPLGPAGEAPRAVAEPMGQRVATHAGALGVASRPRLSSGLAGLGASRQGASAAVVAAPTVAAPTVAAPTVAAPSLAAEVAPSGDDELRDRAQFGDLVAASQRGDARETLRLAEQQSDRFADSQFREDRAFYAIVALGQLQRGAEVTTRAAQFLARYPRSPYAPRVRRIVANQP
ncbi:MAG: hypothetical protein JNK72_14555 [Myxococcales bacterium]|nr:hypothetical protein [Myxococcales bacterium]